MTIFELNANDFADDTNAQFHLGEAFRFTGQNVRAAAQYRRVLELEPEHATVRSRLAQVTGG